MREMAFHHFQARGGFLVSAAKNAQGVYFLEVQPRRDNTCRIMNPWPGRAVIVREAGKTEPVAVKMDKSNGECVEFPAVAGKKYSIEAHPKARCSAQSRASNRSVWTPIISAKRLDARPSSRMRSTSTLRMNGEH
jgi:hypothetical protein